MTGVLLSILALISLFIFKFPLQSAINQLDSKLKPKGAILEPEDEQLEEWLDNLKKDENSETELS